MTKTFSHYPAFPADERIHDMDSCGLTKREYFAAMAMQGILSGDVGINLLNAYDGLGTSSHATLAAFATRYADALIEALNKQEAK